MAAKGKKTHCQQKAAHRAAQNKYVAKNPKAQAARVAKSQQKQSTGKNSGSKSKGAGKNGSKIGRPRKRC
jgi:hypothetical protein